MDDDLTVRTMQLIKNKYLVSESTALKYARMVLDALESHGGSRADFLSISKVVDVVVKSWIEKDRHLYFLE